MRNAAQAMNLAMRRGIRVPSLSISDRVSAPQVAAEAAATKRAQRGKHEDILGGAEVQSRRSARPNG